MSGGGDDFPEEHEEHVNHEAWVIPYADLLTLLMAMFIALFAMSTVDITKFKSFSLGFNEALGGGKLDAGIGGSGKATSPIVGQGNGQGPLTGGTLLPSDANFNSKELAKILSAVAAGKKVFDKQRQTLDQVKNEIDNKAKGLGLGGKITTRQLENGLEVTVLTDQVLFDSGQAILRNDGKGLLALIEQVIATVPNAILIRGYTDSIPIATTQFPSNNYLSAARAVAVAEYFERLGIKEHRIDASGRGNQDPVAPNTTEAGRAKNRRVEIIVQSAGVQEVLDKAGLTDKPAVNAPKPINDPASPDVGGPTLNLNPGISAK